MTIYSTHPVGIMKTINRWNAFWVVGGYIILTQFEVTDQLNLQLLTATEFVEPLRILNTKIYVQQ